MKPKKPNRPITGNVRQINAKDRKDFSNVNNYRTKINFMPGHHYISSNNDNHSFLKNKNEHNKNIMHENRRENHNKVVVDVAESLKHGRNSSAPTLKQNKIKDNKNTKNNKIFKNNYNKPGYNEDFSTNIYNNNHIGEAKDEKRDKSNISYDRTKKNKSKMNFSNKITRINRRIKNIKDNYNSKTNRKYYYNHNIPHNESHALNKTFNDSNKQKINNKNKDMNKDLIAAQEKIVMLKKKLKDDKVYMRNNNEYNSYRLNNTTFNQKSKRTLNTNTIENDNGEDDKKIIIDNEEKILSTDGNFNDNNIYRDITPDKNRINQKNNYSYINNYDSTYTSENFDKTMSKVGNSNNNENKKNNQKKNNDMSGHSYNKKSEHIRKINFPKTRNDRDKDIFNNYHTNNRNYINTERGKNDKKKSKKINIINLKTKQNDYYYTKSSNIFHTVNNNNFNKTTIIPSNPSKHNNDKKYLNKTKFNVSYDFKKNNSVKKTNPLTKKIIGKRNSDKAKEKNRGLNKSLNYTYDKIDISSKKKKYEPKCRVQDNKDKNETQEIQQKEEEEEEKEKEPEPEPELPVEKKLKKIDKIGCKCHPGEISFGKPKTNQDNYFNFNINSDGLAFVGVCDGHGENGHFVSEYLVNHLPLNLQEIYINLKNSSESFENMSQEKITQIFEESFLKTDNELNEHCDNMKKKKLMGEYIPNFFNCDYSGSTCVSILLKQKDINTVYIANAGDSRTIIIRENSNDSWSFEQLSRDHKPTEKDEYKRIIDMDGEIEAIEDDNGNWTGPLRVWEKGSEGPGLAMTRSLGDKVGSKIGVVCTPEVFKYSIKEEDKVIIIASDGLWEYMPNQEVCDYVKELIVCLRLNNNEIDADFIADELFNQSVLRWRQKEQGMDDITIIVVLLQ